VLLEEGRRVLAQAERAERMAERAGRGEVGRLALGVAESASYAVVPELLREYRRVYPAVDLTVRMMTTPAQVQGVRSGEIDAGLARTPADTSGLEERTIQVDPLALLLPEEHALAARESVPLAALSGEPLIVHPAPPRPSWADFLLAVLRQAGVQPGRVQEATGVAMAMTFVAAGLGLTLVPGGPDAYQRPGVVWRPLTEPAPRTRLVLIHGREALPATVRSLLGVVERLWPES
jgi:DNA-binding transcriptional LysR family regulator